MPTRIPTPSDFTPILATHPTFRPNTPSSPQQQEDPITLTYPTPRESTTSILLLFHGLGDVHTPFASFARNLALPGVLAISVRGVSPLPALFTSGPDDAEGEQQQVQGYHWGDDLTFSSSSSSGVDLDPGFEKARRWVMERLVGEVLVAECGWEVGDVMVFGFGQGGSLALGLASALRGDGRPRVEDVTAAEEGEGAQGGERGRAFKGVVSICGGLPVSMVPSVSGLGKAKTPVLVLCGRESEDVDADAVDLLEREFEQAKVVRWNRADDGMPRNRDEVLPMMQFFAERLGSGWP